MTADLKEGELRQDVVTGKWVVIAPSRSKRPDTYAKSHEETTPLAKYQETCPFCNVADFPQAADVLRLPDDPDQWLFHIFPNKYPAFRPHDDIKVWQTGPYRAMEAVGYHEVLATRHHNQVEALLSKRELALELEALVLRYRQLQTKASVNYIQIIKNHGAAAGGSIEHPHHQIFTTPVLPDGVQDSLMGTQKYAHTHQGESVYTVMFKFETASRERLVYENEDFIAFCPYASHIPFEVKILPKQPEPFFEKLSPKLRESLADILQQVLGQLYTGLGDPPYNYYIHSAPCDRTGKVCDLDICEKFRWHIDITPRLNIWGGFELGTGIEINSMPPEEAAAFLREQTLPTQP
jgi:UDPglucose--hexose-1-phosphate uridylyltransferase